jgi:predicted GIY-YIG superfamily endonuclease
MVKPKANIEWTKEKCVKAGKKYSSKKQFRLALPNAYKAAYRNCWLDEIATFMALKGKKPPGYWTKDKCHEEAKKYSSRSEFGKGEPRAYAKAIRCKWIDEICSHMTAKRMVNGYWTKEKCGNEALKFKTRKQFSIESPQAYAAAGKNGWRDEICGHMKGNREKRYWTKDKCAEEAKKYTSRTQFCSEAGSAYKASCDNDWLDEICSHMKEKKKPNGYWTKERCREAAKKYSSRKEFENEEHGAYGAAILNQWIDEICDHMVIQRIPATYWTKKKCQEEAIKYSTRKDFEKGSSSSYKAALRKNWMDQICRHMKVNKNIRQNDDRRRKPLGYWTKENCSLEAKKYTSRSAFWKENQASYQVARANGWLDDICRHMQFKKKPSNYWTKKRCHEEAKKYKNKKEFSINSTSAYSKATNRGWIADICGHMEKIQKPSGYWTKKRCQEAAKKFSSRSSFNKGERGAYVAAYYNGWLDEICKTMKSTRVPNGYWTKARCQIEAKKFESRVQFCNNSPAYSAALKNGWIDDICRHMDNTRKRKGFWTKERCQEVANKYKSRNRFYMENQVARQIAINNGWLDEICAHMIELKKPNNYWTKTRCRLEAKKYNSKRDWREKGSTAAYTAALQNGWIDDICDHMEILGNLSKRWVYVFEFSDKSCYVGVTSDTKRRLRDHQESGILSKKETRDLKYKMIVLDKLYSEKEAIEKEASLIQEYKHSGWTIRNIAKAGSLGGSRLIWTKEKCLAEARKYAGQALSEFRTKSSSAYLAAKKYGWLEEIRKIENIESRIMPRHYWTKERCHEEAKKYSYKGEFQKGSAKAYVAARRNKWLDIICSHMKPR